jgi:chromosomal replication initiation ATPase DnaA
MSIEQLQAHLATAQQLEDERILNEVAAMVRLGLATLQGADRSADVARRRAVAAWILSEHYGWTIEGVARALARTPRQIARFLSHQPKMLRKKGRKSAVVSG